MKHNPKQSFSISHCLEIETTESKKKKGIEKVSLAGILRSELC